MFRLWENCCLELKENMNFYSEYLFFLNWDYKLCFASNYDFCRFEFLSWIIFHWKWLSCQKWHFFFLWRSERKKILSRLSIKLDFINSNMDIAFGAKYPLAKKKKKKSRFYYMKLSTGSEMSCPLFSCLWRLGFLIARMRWLDSISYSPGSGLIFFVFGNLLICASIIWLHEQ